jgi:hypothetical protein
MKDGLRHTNQLFATRKRFLFFNATRCFIFVFPLLGDTDHGIRIVGSAPLRSFFSSAQEAIFLFV